MISANEALNDSSASVPDTNRSAAMPESENGVSKTVSGAEKDHSGGEDETTSRRRRRSRWDSPSSESINNPSSEMSADSGIGTRKRKSRWADDEPKPVIQLPDFMKDFTEGIEFDPEIQALNCRLLDISRMLQSGMALDDRDEGQRSPSPEPIYDNMGIRINTREYRARERLNRERQEIISQIIKKNPAFKPPADYRPPKLQKKLFIPKNQFPGYSFIGLIIGPRGNTHKRMEKETGAKIAIRGKGSAKEGRVQQKKYDPSEDEDLHVLVEAETQEALDAAAGMVEKLLQPVDEVLNEHKRQQLRELATLNGTIRDEEFCRTCGEQGHRQFACPSRLTTFKSDVLCKNCGDGGHPTIDCPLKGTTTGKKMDDEYQNFLAELGGTVPESSPKQSTTTLALGPGSLGSNQMKPSKEYDETNLYIGFLPLMFEDAGLISLFSPFGEIVMAKVIKDHGTGLSKGYGFVKYAHVEMANTAIQAMSGYPLEGRTLVVRIAGKKIPPPTANPAPPAPQPPIQAYPPANGTYPVPWGGPPVPSYYPYAPPPPGCYHPVPGQHVPPYGMHYPPPPPPPGSTTDHSQGLGNNAPWATNPPIPPSFGYSQSPRNVPVPWAPNPSVQPPADNPSAAGETEYEKFMAEMKK